MMGKTATLVLVPAFCCFALSLYGQNETASPTTAQPSPPILQVYDQALDQIAERAMRTVVEINVTSYSVPEHGEEGDTQSLRRERALGSGVIVDPNGYIITNNHVVAGALRIRVTIAPATFELVPYHTHFSQQQRIYEATLIGTNRYADLAVIKIDEKNLPFMPLLPAAQFKVRLGQTVLAIGSPQGLDHTVTKGIVSAVGRQPDLDRPMVYVQTDAPINPGNSGGPLIDRDGNLIGINTFIYTSGGGSEGLGFAIPEPIVEFAYAELKEFGSVPPITINAHAQSITPDLAEAMKLPQNWGVILSDIEPGGPAAAAGLKPKDLVTMIDGFPIDSLPKYTAFLYLHPHGVPMEMKVLRDGNPATVSVNPAVAPPSLENLSELINTKTDLIAALGVFVIDLKGPLVEAMPTRSKSGVIVAGLLSGEPPMLADLQVGDVIFSLNDKPINSTEQLRRELASLKAGDAAVFEVERQSVIVYVAFEVE
jgi:serine protease Do